MYIYIYIKHVNIVYNIVTVVDYSSKLLKLDPYITRFVRYVINQSCML